MLIRASKVALSLKRTKASLCKAFKSFSFWPLIIISLLYLSTPTVAPAHSSVSSFTESKLVLLIFFPVL
nr:MAG TPA: hypothetical protein [Caudoviricetes sp.]